MFNWSKLGKTKLAILSLLLFAVVVVSAYAVFVVADDAGVTGDVSADTDGIGVTAHTSSVDLKPEFTTPGVTNKYNVTICNTGGAPIDEVRIIKNVQYSNFDCADDTPDGWELVFVPNWNEPDVGGATQMCWYFTLDPEDNIVENECEVFKFNATAPSVVAENICQLPWKFETRDQESDQGGAWNSLFDQTHIDTEAPETTKKFIGPQKTEGGVEWIDGVTRIELTATDLSPECKVGVDKIWYANVLAKDAGDTSEASCWTPQTSCNPVLKSPYETCGIDGINRIQKFCTEKCNLNNSNGIGVQWLNECPNFGTWEECVEFGLYNESEEYCNYPTEPGWKLYDGTPIEKDGESCHILQFFSVDFLGNNESMNTNCFFVDKTPPKIKKEIGKPSVGYPVILSGSGTGTAEFVTDSSAHLYAPLITNYPPSNEGRIRIPFSGTLEDLDTLSWGVSSGTGYAPHADIYLSNGEVLTFEYAKVNPANCDIPANYPTGDFNTFKDNGIIDDNAYAWLDSNVAGPCGDLSSGGFESTHKKLSDWKTLYGGQTILAIEIEVDGWISTSEAYINNVQLNGLGVPLFTHVTQGTGITLSCEDQEPHPSDGVAIHYRYKVDEEGDGFADDNWVDEHNEKTEQVTFSFPEESIHLLEYWCADAVEKESPHFFEVDKVDNTPPVITKTMIGTNHLGDCPPTKEGGTCYVADNGENGVRIDVVDPEPIHAVDDVSCSYELWWQTSLDTCISQFGSSHLYNDKTGQCFVEGSAFADYKEIIFHEDSTHTLKITCQDALENSVSDEEDFLVDSTPPTTTKTYGDPHYPSNINSGADYPHYITSQTPITLVATDAKVGVDKTHYRTELVADSYCYGKEDDWTPTYDGDWQTYTAPFPIPEQSCHVIEFYSIDKLGNKEDIKHQYVFVDNTSPSGTKTIGTPSLGNGVSFSSSGTGTSEITDQGAHLYAPLITVYPPSNEGRIHIPGEGMTLNELTSLSWDANVLQGYLPHADVYLSNGEVLTFEYAKVKPSNGCDITPYPIGALNTFGTNGIVDNSAYAWTDIPGPCGDPAFDAQHKSLADWKTLYGGQTILSIEIEVDGWISTSEAGLSNVMLNGESVPLATYVTTQTPITLSCSDPEPHPVDQSTVHWRFSYWPDGYSGEPTYSQEYSAEDSATVYFGEDSWHDLEFYCTDALGNQGTTDTEYFVVDSQAPEITKEVVGPQWGQCPPEPENGESSIQTVEPCYIDGITNISVTVVDPEPHPVNQVQCRWRYNVGGGEYILGGQGLGSEFIVHFPEESSHNLVIECVDGLGNRVTDEETFLVDKTPPVTRKSYGTPFFSNDTAEWITNKTPITLSVEDAGIHKTGIKETKYRVSLVDNEACRSVSVCDAITGTGNFLKYSSPFTIPQESCHLIEYYSVDNVEKTEVTKKQCVFVDNTSPTPLKTVGVPKEPWNGLDAKFYPDLGEFCDTELENCWKVTLDTPISLTCTDPAPHPVDHETVYFKVELDGDNATQIYCTKYEGTYDSGTGYCHIPNTIQDFYFLESSEHNLAFYCADALGNTGPIDDEKFKVGGEGFNITLNKKWNLISTPVVLLSDNISVVFAEINESIESVWTYDPLGELCSPVDDWCVYNPDGAPSNLLKTMQPGWGYWVLAKKDTTLIIGGSLLAPGRTPPSKNLIPGWNLIGYYGTECDDSDGFDGKIDGKCSMYNGPPFAGGHGQDAYAALYSLTSGELGLAKWNSLYGYWEKTEPQFEGYSVLDNLDPGAGYWVSMKDNQQQYIYSPSTVCSGFLGCWLPF